MKKRILGIVLAGILILSFSACSKNTKVESGTYTGTVSSITADSISIVTDDEQSLSIPLTDDTEFTMEGGFGEQPPSGGVPSGAAPSGEAPSGEVPSGGATSGEAPSGGAPADIGEMPSAAITYEDIAEGDSVTVVVNEDGDAGSVSLVMGDMPGMGDMGEMGGMPGGGSAGVDSYDAANTYTSDTELSDVDLTSTGVDENAVLVSDGASVKLEDVTITRDSDSSTGGDNSSFYGVGAAALVTDGTLVISNSNIETDASGGAGVFAYGDGIAYVSDTEITTAQGASGGIHVAGGGTLYAWNLDVETSWASSAAVRSDRGSGTMVIDGGTYTSNGTGSPAVYSTADITINDATLSATDSEAICIEGFNSIRLFDCSLSGNMPDNDQNDCVWNIILYQSMSGDSVEGNSTFEMIGGSLSAESGGMFYTTNTESTFIISNVDITYAADSDFLIKCTGNSNARGWGSSGANGADCKFKAIDQALEGNVIWDSISQLDLYILDGSSLTGAVVNDETNAGDGGNGYAALYIDASSTWIVTGDSTLTSLECEGTIADENGNTVTIAGTDGTVYIQGNSTYSITVESYSGMADVSNASTADSWDSFAVPQAD